MIKIGATHALEVPENVQRYIARAGGANAYGDPRFRIVWSGNRTTLSSRKWTESESDRLLRTTYGWRRSLKYPQEARRERFIIEMYRPPEFYGSPELWYYTNTKYVDGRAICPAGPFPNRGEYEYVDTVEYVDKFGERHFRVVNEEDIIARLPAWIAGFRHSGQCVFFPSTLNSQLSTAPHFNPPWWRMALSDAWGTWLDWRHGKIALLADHPIEQYLARLAC